MRVEQLGEGTPEVAVLGGVHGDEPCGVRAVEHLLEERPAVERPVKCIVANEEAIARDVRYVDEDLNRAFPGDPSADTHEGRLAARLHGELRDCVTLSMHSTQSHPEPFAVVNEVGPVAEAVCPYLSIESIVEAGDFTQGRLVEYADVVEVECGLQRSETAAENGVRLAREFLGAVGALPGEARDRRSGVPIYRLSELIPKEAGQAHEVFVENFGRVAAGEPFAATDGSELVADEPFYPVLLSPYGYENVFGYAADLVGRLEL
ncbi:MAG: succinylglutamate desuccinylase/aspartoacylase family protein [Haloarculaceae archaeon]